MKRFAMGPALALAVAGCAAEGPELLEEKPTSDDTKEDLGKAEAWSAADNPAIFGAQLVKKIAELPLSGQATNVPWASSYWPTYEDNINYKWEGPGTDSPAKKYEKAFGLSGVEDAVSRYHGIDSASWRKECQTTTDCADLKDGSTCAKREGADKGRCIPTWWGICHAWAPASILLPEPKYPVTVNGVTFKVNDIKALVTLVHDRTQTKFVSQRCNDDASGDDMIYDEYGRATGMCRDTNPGTFHLLLTNYLGKQGQSFVYDRTWDDEVWNQPIRSYRITQQKEVTLAEANRLIGVTSVGGTTVDREAVVDKGQWQHFGSFAVAAGEMVKVRMTGDNDADLYVRFGAEPTDSQYDCRPYAGGSSEECELTVPANVTAVYVSVKGYSSSPSSVDVKITTGGRIPDSYPFNPRAVKFFHNKLEVKYIGESSSATDGNLSAVIDRYTHTDTYEYILEVDAGGEIIGGEWVGASKKAHPDFLWLPIGPGSSSVAGGKITYARVKELLDKSLVPPGGGGSGPGEDKTVTDSGSLARAEWKHFGPFRVAAGRNLTATISGTGDVDLYVRKGQKPTDTGWDCRPYRSGSSEACTVVGPGEVYVAVKGYAASSTYTLTIQYTEGSGAQPPPVDPPVTVTHLHESGEVAQGESKFYTVNVIAGRKIVIRTMAPHDVDLYIQMGAAPTTSAYLMRAWTTSGNETITYTPTSSGTLHIMVHGYAASSFTLTTSDQ